MNQIEIIEIRSLYKTKEKLEVELQKILTDIKKEEGCLEVKIYSRINLETDFLLLIMHSSDTDKNGESQLGVLLNEGLKDFGMVNYSKWNELTPVAFSNIDLNNLRQDQKRNNTDNK